MKIVNIKKFIRSILITLLIIFVLSLLCSKSTLSHKEVELKNIYVSNGDTLWNLAKELQLNNDFYKNKDLRDIIANVKEVNNLESSNLYIGQELTIPVI